MCKFLGKPIATNLLVPLPKPSSNSLTNTIINLLSNVYTYYLRLAGKPIPDVPFPNVNEAKVMKQWVVRKNLIGYSVLALSCVGVGAMAVGMRMFLLPLAVRVCEKKL